MRKVLAIAMLALLAACATENQAAKSVLTSAGVSTANADKWVQIGNTVGQLSCYAASSGWFQVAGANVVGATATAVQQVCAAANPDSVPGALPAGTVPVVKMVGNAVLSQLNQSKN